MRIASPNSRIRKAWVIEVALGLIEREGRWFRQRRDPAAAVLPGRWEFPGGKVEPGESPMQACRRELVEEVGLDAPVLSPLEPITHPYGDRTVRLHPFRVAPGQVPITRLAWGWFSPQEIQHLPIPEANTLLVDRLATRTGE